MVLKIVLMMLTIITLPIIVILCMAKMGKEAEIQQIELKKCPEMRRVIRKYSMRFGVMAIIYLVGVFPNIYESIFENIRPFKKYQLLFIFIQILGLAGIGLVDRQKVKEIIRIRESATCDKHDRTD